MIKAKIKRRAGAVLERELSTYINELHHAPLEMDICKTPRSILLQNDNAAEAELTADSKIGNRLLRVFGKNDTLADANTVAFVVSTAREEILPELEQNIIHNQYLTKEMLFEDIRDMLPPVFKSCLLSSQENIRVYPANDETGPRSKLLCPPGR